MYTIKQPRVKPVLFPLQRSNHRIILGMLQYGASSELQDDEDDHIWQLIQLMDGSRTMEEVVRSMLKKDPQLDEASINDAIHSLVKEGFVEDASAPLPSNITTGESDRYSRHTNYFAWIDRKVRTSPHEIQSKLKQARVTIVGLGGIGSSTALSLTAAGIGSLHCVDFDHIEQSNLARQVLYREQDLGLSKVKQAVRHLQSLNSYSKITGRECKITAKETMIALMQECDLLILSADEPYTELRLWTNEAAIQTNTSWIENHTAGPTVAVTMFKPFQTPCYACLLHTAQQQEQQLGFLDPTIFDRPAPLHAAIAPIVNIAGQITALEALYFLAGLSPYTLGKQFLQNFLTYDHLQYTPLEFWSDCPVCGSNSPYR